MRPTEFKGRVLVVDDEDVIRELEAEHLRSEGYEVHEAATATDALREAETFHPEVIVLDVVLPDGSGYDVCRQMKRNAVLVDVPVIFVTATLRGDAHQREGYELGAHEYLEKGAGLFDQLREKTARLIEVRRMFGGTC